MSQERARKIPVNCSGRRTSSPVACTAPSTRVSPKPNAGAVPQLAGRLTLNVSTHSFGRRDVPHVHQHRLGAVHVEHLTAGTLHETMRRLALSIAGRLKSSLDVTVLCREPPRPDTAARF